MEKETIRIKTLQEKLATHFGVKTSGSDLNIKVSDDERTIKAIANTYFLIDSDQDMLVPGSSTKSISDRGPSSSATAKIKHQSDHILNSNSVVGRITKLEEKEMDGKTVLYFESFIPNTRKGNDDLENYKQGIYDNHSIGFRYKKLDIAVKDSADESERKLWDEFIPKALNPEKAEEAGFFWVVKEIELFEISVVSFGANSLTPYLGSKSKDATRRIKSDLLDRVDNLNAQLKSTANTKDERKTIDLEFLQLKQIINDLELNEPSKKSTQSITEPDNNDTTDEESKPKINLLIEITKRL